MAAINSVRTIALVARDLGVEEKLLYDLALGFDPEDGCLWVCDTNREIQAFTDYGVENLITLLQDLHNWTPPQPSRSGILWKRIKARLRPTTD
jgi:hypothetical protein